MVEADYNIGYIDDYDYNDGLRKALRTTGKPCVWSQEAIQNL